VRIAIAMPSRLWKGDETSSFTVSSQRLTKIESGAQAPFEAAHVALRRRHVLLW
jgi:hypothetical protein